MKEIIETLYPMNACLLGEGYDNRLEFIKHLLFLEVLEFPSGTTFGTWTVPEEWVVRDAWVKLKGEKIIDYQKQPLSLVVGSPKTYKIVNREELRVHLNYSDDMPDATPYAFKFYDKDWGFCVPKNQVREETDEADPLDGFEIDGQKYFPKTKDKLPEGQYEVFIDAEYKPGVMKVGVHTIQGKSDREILIFAHLDHPFQANDNLSAVACLIDLARKIKCDHTVKLVFCPETIGSVAYAYSEDISKVDFMIAVDICGNENSIMLQKSLNGEEKINRITHLAIHSFGETYRKGAFRASIGSDEYVFNDPQINIPGIMLSTWPYKEYHTSEDTPDKFNYEKIEKVGKIILKIIEIWEKDFIPKREFKGPLMRSKYGIQTPNPQVNLSWDYFIYAIDGKRSLAELCCEYGLNFDIVLEVILRMEKDGQISRADSGKVKKQKASRKKHTKLQRSADVSSKHKEVSQSV